ncbi:hypothetical protein AZE42_12325 [Rhizopogon vesiculosus]|uniref:Uncharacterized protein n=1 Tax=Rhizopogon vesiculosus TaxID=180088 RepID=A0A1J8QI82_9AGAM|nr:hypothetical protein AZE42_12325 [Rhizopogon vesiculosus]
MVLPQDSRHLHLFLSPTLRRCELHTIDPDLKYIVMRCVVLERLSFESSYSLATESNISLLSDTIRSCNRLVELCCQLLDSERFRCLANLPTLVGLDINQPILISSISPMRPLSQTKMKTNKTSPCPLQTPSTRSHSVSHLTPAVRLRSHLICLCPHQPAVDDDEESQGVKADDVDEALGQGLGCGIGVGSGGGVSGMTSISIVRAPIRLHAPTLSHTRMRSSIMFMSMRRMGESGGGRDVGVGV